jgi:hypothetical protein
MGEATAETVKEIEQVRERLTGELEDLQERLPAPVTLAKRVAGVAMGGGVGGTVFWFVVRRIRGRSTKKKTTSKRRKAEHVVVEFAVPDVNVRWLEDGRWRVYAVGGLGVWLALRLAELRAERRTAKALRRAAEAGALGRA